MAAVANSGLPDRGGDEGRGTGVLYEVCRSSSDANIACLPQHEAESTK